MLIGLVNGFHEGSEKSVALLQQTNKPIAVKTSLFHLAFGITYLEIGYANVKILNIII